MPDGVDQLADDVQSWLRVVVRDGLPELLGMELHMTIEITMVKVIVSITQYSIIIKVNLFKHAAFDDLNPKLGESEFRRRRLQPIIIY